MNSIRSSAETSLNTIKNLETNSSTYSKNIQDFASRVAEREEKFSEISEKTTEYHDKLNEYEEEHQRKLEEANKLINSAKEALFFKTSEGLSATFNSQYQKANGWWKLNFWIIASAICLGATLGVGIWVINNIQDQWFMILGRILLLPIPIIAAVFCANQYTKQKNIIEDYAYKQTIAKAIVGLSEQLKKNGKEEDNSEYVDYIRMALTEIHKDPLRSRKEPRSTNIKTPQMEQVIELAKKILDVSQKYNN